MALNGMDFIVSLATAALASVGTGPAGQVDIPAGDPAALLRSNDAPWEVRVKDRAGAQVGVLRSGGASGLPHSAYPAVFLDALVVSEDVRFGDHPGMDGTGTLKAAADTLRGRTRGGSGLLQQLVKMRVTGNAPTLSRKLTEATVAFRVASLQPAPEAIVESYLSTAWFGRRVEGAALAPRAWFGKEWADVTPAEALTLVVMLRAPARYDPGKDPARVKVLRDRLAGRMLDLGRLDAVTHDAIVASPVEAVPEPPPPVGEDWILSAARYDPGKDPARVKVLRDRLAGRMLDLGRLDAVTHDAIVASPVEAVPEPPPPVGEDWILSAARRDLPAGLSGRTEMTTTIEKDWQDIVQSVLSGKMADVPGAGAEGGMNAAAVVIDIASGDVLASVGGVARSGYDRTSALRQPGSAAKPLFFLAAIDAGLEPNGSLRNDSRGLGTRDGWRPRNYDGREGGPGVVHEGLERSSNLMTLHLSDHVDPDIMFETAERAGAWPAGAIRRILPSLLGASETDLRSLTAGLAGIAAGGRRVDEASLAEAPHGIGPAFSSPWAAEQVARMMRGVVVRGTASAAFGKSPMEVIGKTGTSEGPRDGLFVGMTRDVAVGVWVGRDDDRPFPEAYIGGRLPARMARAILDEARAGDLLDTRGLRPGAEGDPDAVPWPPQPFGRGEDGARPEGPLMSRVDSDPLVEAGAQAVVDMIDAGADANADLW